MIKKKQRATVGDHIKARVKAENKLTGMGLYIPRCPKPPEELDEWIDEEGMFNPPPSATEFDDEELGVAMSYTNALAEFVDVQLGLIEVEYRAAFGAKKRLEEKLLGDIPQDRNIKMTIAKSKVLQNPELRKLTKIVTELEGQKELLERFLKAYDRRCQALSRELTRRSGTTARWEKSDRGS